MNLFQKINNLSVDFSIYKHFEIKTRVQVILIDCPEHIKRWIEGNNLEIGVCELFITPPGENMGAFLHIDGHEINHSVPKFNWATPSGVIIWMQSDKEKFSVQKLYTDHGTKYLRVARSSCIELARTEIKNETTLIEAGIPHMINYSGSLPRYSLSITIKKLKKEITYSKLISEINS
jgi:hypothetical protein